MSDQEIQQYESLKEPMALGEVFAKSGLFPDAKTQAQAAVKILAGREIGLTPFESMSGIYFVNGRISLMANIKASLVKKSKTHDYTIINLDDNGCTISFFRLDKNGESTKIGDSTFTTKDAAKAGLINKEVYKSYPRNMFFARALSNGVTWYCPEVIRGYATYEELEEIETITPTKTIELTANGEVKTNGEETVSQ